MHTTLKHLAACTLFAIRASAQSAKDIRGNAFSMKAYREGTRPFPDGAIRAKLA